MKKPQQQLKPLLRPKAPPTLSSETICAISTPIGEGGIGIIRLSGPKSIAIVDRLFRRRPSGPLHHVATHTVHYGRLMEPLTGEVVDEVLVTVMRAPRTYTREDIVEINAHGGPLLLRRILGLLTDQGARMAEPGEFTQRAFLSGRIDLTQAEAVMDLISAKTEASGRAALNRLQGALGREIQEVRDRLSFLLAYIEAAIDFSEEDLELLPPSRAIELIQEGLARVQRLLDTAEEGRILRDGLATVIVGRPNVGKSSLLNCLLKQDRAIVTPLPGTTRDLLEEYLNIKGIPLRLIDTAGLRLSFDPIEQEGMRRTEAAMAEADLLLVLIDASQGLFEQEESLLRKYSENKKVLAVINKIDLAPTASEAIRQKIEGTNPTAAISATQGLGLEELKEAIVALSLSTRGGVGSHAVYGMGEEALVAHVRHKSALIATQTHLEQALESVKAGMPEEIIALEIRDALDRLGEIIGATTTEEILDRIFQSFCIGK